MMQKTAPTAPKKARGRPAVHLAGRRTSFYVDAAELEELRSFARWRSFREGIDVSLSRALFDSMHECETFRRFRRETSAK